jgi:hypothetical protein
MTHDDIIAVEINQLIALLDAFKRKSQSFPRSATEPILESVVSVGKTLQTYALHEGVSLVPEAEQPGALGSIATSEPGFLKPAKPHRSHASAIAQLTPEQRAWPCARCHCRREQHEFGRGICTGSKGVFLCHCNRYKKAFLA